MYTIQNGKGYKIEGNKAYGVKFYLDGKVVLVEDDIIDITENQKVYSYNEIIKKLNVKYMLEQAIQKKDKVSNQNEELNATLQENDLLKEEIKNLKEKIQKYEEEISIYEQINKDVAEEQVEDAIKKEETQSTTELEENKVQSKKLNVKSKK